MLFPKNLICQKAKNFVFWLFFCCMMDIPMFCSENAFVQVSITWDHTDRTIELLRFCTPFNFYRKF